MHGSDIQSAGIDLIFTCREKNDMGFNTSTLTDTFRSDTQSGTRHTKYLECGILTNKEGRIWKQYVRGRAFETVVVIHFSKLIWTLFCDSVAGYNYSCD